MSDQVQGQLDIQDSAGQKTSINLNGDTAGISVGGEGGRGDLVLKDDSGKVKIHLGRELVGKPPLTVSIWALSIEADDGTRLIRLGSNGVVDLGGIGVDGVLSVKNKHGKLTITADSAQQRLVLRDKTDNDRITLDASKGVKVTQTDTERAGYFEIQNKNNSMPALEGSHKGSGAGVTGTSKDADGVYAASGGTYKSGVYGSASDPSGYGVSGRNTNFNDNFGALGARPILDNNIRPCAVYGWASDVTEEGWGSAGVFGKGDPFLCVGVQAESDHYVALSAVCLDSIQNPDNYYVVAGDFQGSVRVAGQVWASTKNCRIDHPLDPANKYLTHACVESSERLNIYRGSVTLNSRGEATVRLPKWVQAFNSQFEYQLTPVGGSAPNLHIGKEINDGRFRIAGGRPGQRVSWQVSGVRADAYARAHPLRVEIPKREGERGTYLNPIEHGKSEKERFRLEKVAAVRRRSRSRPRRRAK